MKVGFKFVLRKRIQWLQVLMESAFLVSITIKNVKFGSFFLVFLLYLLNALRLHDYDFVV